MPLRGIRGAITVEEDRPEAILEATRHLLDMIVSANPGLQPEEVGSVIFTTTDDLTAAFPAVAARQMGWTEVPLLCTHEIPVPDGLPRCIRVLLHWNTERSQDEIRHVYLEAAFSLRPDLNQID